MPNPALGRREQYIAHPALSILRISAGLQIQLYRRKIARPYGMAPIEEIFPVDTVIDVRQQPQRDGLIEFCDERRCNLGHVRFKDSGIASSDVYFEVVLSDVDRYGFVADLARDSKQRMRFEVSVDDDSLFNQAHFVDLVAKLRWQIEESGARGTI